MTRPPFGLVLPARFVRLRDGDTPEVQCLSSITWAVRLSDCWCPETKGKTRTAGRRSMNGAYDLMETATDLALQIPPPDQWRDEFARREAGTWPESMRLHPLALFTFDRVVGVLWLDEKRTLNEELIAKGLATRTKRECVERWGNP